MMTTAEWFAKDGLLSIARSPLFLKPGDAKFEVKEVMESNTQFRSYVHVGIQTLITSGTTRLLPSLKLPDGTNKDWAVWLSECTKWAKVCV